MELQRPDPEPRTRERRCSTHFTAGAPSKGVILIQMGQVEMNTSPATQFPLKNSQQASPPGRQKLLPPILSHSVLSTIPQPFVLSFQQGGTGR